MDRSARVTNPEHFNANGTVKKSPKKWKRSERFRRLALKRQELERRLAAERKRSHGRLANRILTQAILLWRRDAQLYFFGALGKKPLIRAS